MATLIQKHRSLLIFLGLAFLLFSWPFFSFPITDGDVSNWSEEAYQLSKQWNFLTAANDQAHGPLLVWTSAVSLAVFGKAHYALNFFNVLVGMLGVFFVYFFSMRFWNNKTVANLSCLIFLSSIAPVYLSRTPMYDWPATIFFFGFCGFYGSHFLEKRPSYLAYSLLCIGLASLSRFSISLGLAGIFVFILHVVFKRGIVSLIRNGVLLTIVILLFNSGWFLGQVSTSGMAFIQEFFVDNIARYYKSTRPNATVRLDFYGLPLYVLIGFLPFTFTVIASFFQKDMWQRIKNDDHYKLLFAGFLPALIIFSFSGHTKLGRYISYVFPFMIVILSHSLVLFDLKREAYRKRCSRYNLILLVLLLALLVHQAFKFSADVESGTAFVWNTIFLLLSLLTLGYFSIKKWHQQLLDSPIKMTLSFSLIYFIFFSFLTPQMDSVPFLNEVKQQVNNTLGIPN